MVSVTEIHKAVDQLSPDSLSQLYAYIVYLRHKATHPGSAWARTRIV